MEVEQQDRLADVLIYSLKRKEVKKATKVLEKGADPNYIGPEGFAGIHLAAGLDGYAGSQLLNLMLSYGGDANLKSSDCETALHVAVMWNRDSAVKKLLESGADPTIRNSDGLTAFDLAENTSDHEQRCLDVLRNSYCDNSSESDVSPHERTAHWRPSFSIDMTHNSKNERLRSSLNATNLMPMEFIDSVDGAQPQIRSPRDSLQGPFGQPPPIGFKPSVLPQPGEIRGAEMPPPIGFIGVNGPSPPGFMEMGDRSVPQQIPQSNWLSPQMMPPGYRPPPTITPQQNGPSPQVITQPNGPSPPMMPQQYGPSPAITSQHNGPTPQTMPQQNGPGPQMMPHQNGPSPQLMPQQNGPSARMMPPQHGQFIPMMPHFNGPFPPMMLPPHGPPPQMMPQQPGMFPNMVPQPNVAPSFSNNPYVDDTRSLNGPKDSFFDVTIAPKNDAQEDGDKTLTNNESFDSDIQDSIDGAFSWDSDIDSSTSYFSLPKHSLKGLITELKSGEERHMVHNGVNGEASLILGSDFESRISLGEIPLSLIKNTNESIISEQFKRNSGKKSAEKLFLRRAKLLDKQSKLSVPRNNFQSTSSINHTSNGPYSPMSPRPRLFRSPFPLINANEPVFETRLDVLSHDGDASIREAVVRDAERQTNKVDKTTQKFFDPPVTPDGKTLRPDTFAITRTRSSGVEHNSDKQNKLKRQPQLAAAASQQINPSSSNTGSADANTHTPSTEEYRSKPPSGNEETESEFPLMQGFGSPRNLYSDMNETPSTIPRTRTLFDQAFITPNDTTTSNLPDGDIFKFGTQDGGGNREVLGASRNIATVQRKINVLGQNESDVFTTDAESHDGESDGNSSGYSGDMSQFSSPDDVTAVATPKFDLKNSPSVTLRNKRRKDMLNDRGTGKLEKQSSTDSNGTVEASKPDEVKAQLPASPRKRLNGITSSDDEANQDKLPNHKPCSLHPSPSKMKSPGHKTRHKVDHTFGEQASLKSPLLQDELKSYHKSQLDKPVHARRKWEHKYECKCELCMTKKGHTNNAANLPFCEHEQCNENKEAAFDDVTVEYDWKDVSLVSSTNNDNTIAVPEDVKALDAEELKQRLVKAGEKPGPINDTTKNIYMKHLARVEAGVIQKGTSSMYAEYMPEMREELKQLSSKDYSSLEDEMVKGFENPQKHKWREGNQKTSFNYILFDPRVTGNLQEKAKTLSETEVFHCFIRSIFYVGKGKESRPYEHLHDAVKMKKLNDKAAKTSDKLNMILNIWQAGYGVVSLHLFHSVIPVEAYTREACMIEAMGLTRLTNLKKGEYYGPAASWKIKKKRHLGIHLLKKALKIFLVEGEKQLKEADL